MCYFCIFVLTFQSNIKFNNCHVVVFFVLVVEKRASLPSAGCLRAIKPHLRTTHALFCNCELRVIYACLNGVVGLSTASLNKMRSRSCPRGGSWTASLSRCVFTAPGSRLEQPARLRAAVTALLLCVRPLTGLVQEAADNQTQAEWFSPPRGAPSAPH